MEWSDLKIFFAIARTGTLGEAARRLGQTQPTMGRRLNVLEKSIGQLLFQRTSKGFLLTDEGQSVFARAVRIEEETIALERELAGRKLELDGLIRISTMDWFGAYVLTPIFAKFLKLHPKVSIELVADSRMVSLSRREADLGFRNLEFNEPDVVQKKISQSRLHLYGSKRLPALRPNGEGASLISMNTEFDFYSDVAWTKKHLAKATITYRSNSREIQARACKEGVGYAVLPEEIGDSIASIKRIPMKENPPSRDVWLGYHRDLGRQARLRALIDFLVDN